MRYTVLTSTGRLARKHYIVMLLQYYHSHLLEKLLGVGSDLRYIRSLAHERGSDVVDVVGDTPAAVLVVVITSS